MASPAVGLRPDLVPDPLHAAARWAAMQEEHAFPLLFPDPARHRLAQLATEEVEPMLSPATARRATGPRQPDRERTTGPRPTATAPAAGGDGSTSATRRGGRQRLSRSAARRTRVPESGPPAFCGRWPRSTRCLCLRASWGAHRVEIAAAGAPAIVIALVASRRDRRGAVAAVVPVIAPRCPRHDRCVAPVRGERLSCGSCSYGFASATPTVLTRGCQLRWISFRAASRSLSSP